MATYPLDSSGYKTALTNGIHITFRGMGEQRRENRFKQILRDLFEGFVWVS